MSDPESVRLRQRLVDQLRERGSITTDEIARAFLAVPREVFVPGVELEEVYQDRAIITKEESGVPISSSSQPAMMALMLQQLDVRPGMGMLEIGSGTGYNAALLQELTGDEGQVTSLEIDPEVASWARRRLALSGYTRVDVFQADGAGGWPGNAPYDRIELTVGTADVAPAWAEQLRENGVLVAPFWINTVQFSIAFIKRNGVLESKSASPCGFTRIQGRLAGADQFRILQPGVLIATGTEEPVDDVVRVLIANRSSVEEIDGGEWYGLATYLALREPLLMLSGNDERSAGFTGMAFGLLDSTDQSLCLINDPMDDSGKARVLSYGRRGARERVGSLLDAWRAAGSPGVSEFRFSLHPKTATFPPSPETFAFDTEFWTLRVRQVHQEEERKRPAG